MVIALALCGLALGQDAVDYDQLDARGFWVADTAGEPWRPVRLAYPEAPKGWDAGLMIDVANRPLVEDLPEGRTAVVDTMASAHAYGGLSWRGMRFEAALPTTLYGHDLGGGFAAAGDARLDVMLPAFEPDRAWPGVGVQANVWLPTGTATRWSGSPGAAAGGVLTVAEELGPVGWTLNGGVRVGRSSEARNLVAGAGPVGGVEAHYRVLDNVALGGGLAVQGATGFQSWPLEATARARYRMKTGGFAILGFAQGIGDGVGASSGRLFFGVGWSRRTPSEPPAPVVVPVVLSQREHVERAPGAPLAELVDDKIVLYEQVFFREGRATLLPESEPVLSAILQVLEDHPEADHLLVEGHTNSRGGARYNQRLSQARAMAVVDWLIDHGIEPDRLLAHGFGEDRPLVADDDPDAMMVNRRVEFTVMRSDESGEHPHVPSLDELPPEARQDP